MKIILQIVEVVVLIVAAVLIIGCDEQDERVINLAREAADRQATQNEEMIRLNREVAEGTRRLVAADGESRKAFNAAYEKLQTERSALTDGWAKLDVERKDIAKQRRTESLVAVGVREGGGIILATIALLIVFIVVWVGRGDPVSDAAVIDALLMECGPDGALQLPLGGHKPPPSHAQLAEHGPSTSIPVNG